LDSDISSLRTPYTSLPAHEEQPVHVDLFGQGPQVCGRPGEPISLWLGQDIACPFEGAAVFSGFGNEKVHGSKLKNPLLPPLAMLDFFNVFKGFITFDFVHHLLLLTLKTVSSIRLQYQISTPPFRWFLRAAERVCKAEG